jgi:uncharacterized damage-inducible protein DinB
MAVDPRIRILIDVLEQGYRRRAWHGPNLRGALRGVTPAQALRRPRPGRHNIWELAVHCAYWKYAVRRRLAGEPEGSFALGGSNWFPRRGPAATAAWKADQALIAREHEALLAAVAALNPRRLDRPLGRGPFTVAQTIAGAAAHDFYHAGQIQLIKRLLVRRQA